MALPGRIERLEAAVEVDVGVQLVRPGSDDVHGGYGAPPAPRIVAVSPGAQRFPVLLVVRGPDDGLDDREHPW